jgi:hypothetical protein
MSNSSAQRKPTIGITQVLQADTIEFLSCKHTDRANISVEEVMRLYKSPEDRARRVLVNLVKNGALRSIGNDTWIVTV